MTYSIDKKHLLNESDVEQKVIWPLLIQPEPIGLGYNKTHVQTKMNLKKITIEKRKNARLYYPDYVILLEGVPHIVIEAKKVDDDLVEAYREARLYALEINALYPSDLNPCKLIIASDGLKLLAGAWDNNTPQFELETDRWTPTDSGFSAFLEAFSFRKIEKESDAIKKLLRTRAVYKKPTHSLGGKHIQNQLIKNTFGETISIQYRHLFNPTNEPERADVVKNAYVKVQKHMSHVTPIDRLIRKKIRPSIFESNEIEDNTVPNEIISKLNDATHYNNQVLLLIGSVGSGKSTFTTYLKEVGLEQGLTKQLTWVRLDLNEAPVNSQEIYKWLKISICSELAQTLPDIDPAKMEYIKKIYYKELRLFNNVALELFEPSSQEYKEKLFNKIMELKEDIDKQLTAYIDFYVHRKHKELIIVLDNCDKRNLEEQLLMFEVANWLKENTKSIVFLPLRETTFDHFKHQKPLDTVIKDLIFRINPPSLEKVIYRRIKYASRISNKSKDNFYFLENNMRVSYPSKDELSYLRSILKSLFQNTFFKKLLTGVAGRDIRKGIEIFLDFCKSGHISENEILKMTQSKGEYSLTNHIISRVFIRGNRLYYADSNARIKNLFYSDPSDKLPNPFVRVAILTWLKDRNRIKGPSGITGYHKVNELIKDLNVLGHSIDRLNLELKTLINNALIISESQDSNQLKDDELVSINSPGLIHMELLGNIDYLSSCSEDVWYRKVEIANNVSARISGNGGYSQFSLPSILENSSDLIEYLEDYGQSYFSVQKEIINSDMYKEPLDFDKIKSKILQIRKRTGIPKVVKMEMDSIAKAKIVNILNQGLICELKGTTQVGFLHVSEIEPKDISDFDIGDELEVVIKKFKIKHNKYDLILNK